MGVVAEKQRTVAAGASVAGVGLHTGQHASIRVLPAPPNAGVVFIRTDLPHKPAIPVTVANAADTGVGMRRTMLAKDGVEVHTVEHFLAALWGLGVDNAYVEIAGPELPGVDGSAGPYVQAIKAAGVVEQEACRRYVTPREAIVVEEAGSTLAMFPAKSFRVSYTLSYPHPALKSQFASFELNGAADGPGFDTLIAPARTFCLQEEAEALRAKGFGLGATTDNTLVVGQEGVIKNTLRFGDEFVRHKILDLIGDLYLLGARLRAHVMAIKSGHALNLKLLHKLGQSMEQWRCGSIESGTREVMVGPSLDVTQIQQILPHRYPFLLVDRITELTESRAVGIKNVTINDYFFQGHFPGKPVMPGVLMIEAMAQIGGVIMLNKAEHKGRLAYFTAIDSVRFRRPVGPGDQLVFEVELTKARSRIGQCTGKAFVDGKLACEGELMFALSDD